MHNKIKMNNDSIKYDSPDNMPDRMILKKIEISIHYYSLPHGK